MSSQSNLQARIRTLRQEAEGILSVELVPLPGMPLPPFTAGAHIDLHLANGLTRSYSLSNAQDETDRYVLGVLADSKSRGGSRYIHENFRCGATLNIGVPRNAFALDESASASVLVAGGIGITPILCMYRRLMALQKAHDSNSAGGDVFPGTVKLVYCARSRLQAAFLDELHALGGDIHLHFDDEHDGKPFDLDSYMAQQAPDVHAYCCGPSVMLNAFEAACTNAGIRHVHVERFAADPGVSATPRSGYQVELAKSGLTLEVPADASLLETLIAAGIQAEHSCMEGICGACETRVLSGCPDHRDSVLSTAEKASNKVMMICVSGAKEGKLVLDL